MAPSDHGDDFFEDCVEERSEHSPKTSNEDAIAGDRPSCPAPANRSDDIFKDCIEDQSEPSPNTPKVEQISGTLSSSPAPTTSNGTEDSRSPQTPQQQTQEKFHAARAEYENKRYVACRDRCMDLLRSRNLPPITRCLTLQMFASCSYYYGAKHALERALIIANELGDEDPEGELKRDVECLLEELEEYRPEEGARPYIREFEVDDY